MSREEMKGDGEQRRGEQKSNNHTIAPREETGGGGASYQQQRRVDVVGGPEWDAGDAARSTAHGEKLNTFNHQ